MNGKPGGTTRQSLARFQMARVSSLPALMSIEPSTASAMMGPACARAICLFGVERSGLASNQKWLNPFKSYPLGSEAVRTSQKVR